MSTRKRLIRDIVLEILFGRETVEYEPSQFRHLSLGVSQVIARRESAPPQDTLDASSPKLSDDDAVLLQEVFWDLFVDKIITIGADPSNLEYPWFRLHSEAEQNLKKL